MIELKKIFKKYNNTVLNNVNLNFEYGNIYILKGISGSGKTTLFNILSGLDKEYDGKFIWDNIDMSSKKIKSTDYFFNKTTYVFQKSFLFKNLTVMENLLFICSDLDKIKKLSCEFDVEKLLDKKPDCLSGGEKQRISLIRALLLDSKLMLLDEPTSSLDPINSKKLVNYINKIDKKNKIIIIATHKDIYDEIADCILEISYGNITKIKSKSINSEKYDIVNYEYCKDNKKKSYKNTIKYDLMFGKQRRKKKLFVGLISFLLFLFIFSLISIIINTKREFTKLKANDYPLTIIPASEFEENELNDIIDKKYYNYKIDTDDYSAYILLEDFQTMLSKEKVLKYGKYPKNNNEVLVNDEFVQEMYHSNDYNQYINKEINIKNNSFKISGIIQSDKNYDFEIYEAIPFYKEIGVLFKNNISPAVFIPYEKMKDIGSLNNDYGILISLSLDNAINLYNSKNSEIYNLPWLSRINDSYDDIIYIVKIIIIAFVIFLIFVFVFIDVKILLELRYKQKEIGYLQLFRISINRIKFIYLYEYLYEIIISLLLSIITFYFICYCILLKTNMYYFLSVSTFTLIITIIIIYLYFLIIIPISMYTKKNIIKLINS